MLNLVISATDNILVELFDENRIVSESCNIVSNQSEDILKMVKNNSLENFKRQ